MEITAWRNEYFKGIFQTRGQWDKFDMETNQATGVPQKTPNGRLDLVSSISLATATNQSGSVTVSTHQNIILKI